MNNWLILYWAVQKIKTLFFLQKKYTSGNFFTKTGVVVLIAKLFIMKLNFEKLKQELYFQRSRSSGKGGQNVNKVETKVEIRLDVAASTVLEANEKTLIFNRLKHRISSAGMLQVVNQETRSQLQNKERALKKLENLLEQALKPIKKRKAPKKNLKAKYERLKNKKIQANKKANRKKINFKGIDLFLF